mmetsp:Transcript_33337/g.81854  ORF Transcript_33337/g.81854 Transcript_33337/m.81854 type:complete len:233 (+) Transcript_33337:989-1687(+)
MLCLIRHWVPVRAGEIVARVLDLIEDDGDALVLIERRKAAEQDVKDHPSRPHVALHAVALLQQHLWRHIDGRAADCPHHVQLLSILHDLPQAEVRYLYGRVFPLAPVQDIFRLEVPVHHPDAVDVVDCRDDLHKHLRRFRLRVVVLGHDPVEELAPGDHLHHNVHVSLGLEHIMECDAVRVPDPLQDVDLAMQLGLVLHLALLLGNDLDRHLLSVCRPEPLLNHRKPALPQH